MRQSYLMNNYLFWLNLFDKIFFHLQLDYYILFHLILDAWFEWQNMFDLMQPISFWDLHFELLNNKHNGIIYNLTSGK